MADSPRLADSPLLVFDLDGTLVDTAPDLLGTLDAVLVAHGYEPVAFDAARPMIGRGARALLESALAAQGARPDPPALDAMHADFLVHYEAHIADSSLPYAGVPEMLDRFADAGWRFAICTNKPERLSRLLLGELRLASRFAAICGADTFRARKPDPLHVHGTVRAAGGGCEAAILVGDSRTDVDAARAAGIPLIGVSFGYTPVPMRDMAPDALIDAYHELTVGVAAGLLEASLAHRPPAARA
jgi:phosphoglycolate phosphatase